MMYSLNAPILLSLSATYTFTLAQPQTEVKSGCRLFAQRLRSLFDRFSHYQAFPLLQPPPPPSGEPPQDGRVGPM
jgi:hypothetical protein